MHAVRLYRITAPHFCAGLLVSESGKVAQSAPILKWARGKPWVSVKGYCEQRRWRVEFIEP